MSNMVLSSYKPHTCGYVCRCGSIPMNAGKIEKRKIKKSVKQREKRQWKKEI